MSRSPSLVPACALAVLIGSCAPDPPYYWFFSFEDGTKGWAPASWANAADSVAQSTVFATHGKYGLEIDAAGGDWFGPTFVSPTANFTPKTHLSWDVRTTGTGTSQNVAFQLGRSLNWCQGSEWTWIDPGSTAHIEVDLGQVSCEDGAVPDLGEVHALYLYFSAGGPYYIDSVALE